MCTEQKKEHAYLVEDKKEIMVGEKIYQLREWKKKNFFMQDLVERQV